MPSVEEQLARIREQQGKTTVSTSSQGKEYVDSSGGSAEDANISSSNTVASSNGSGNKNILIVGIAIGVVILIVLLVIILMMVLKNNKVEDGGSFFGGGATEESDPFADLDEFYDTEGDGSDISNEPSFEDEVIFEDEIMFSYTEEEIEGLRNHGYVADEIEQFEFEQVPYDELIAEADAKRQEYIDSMMAAVSDETSEAYNKIMNETWLGLEERNDADRFVDAFITHSETKNLDYEKIPVHGNQIFIKVYLDDYNHESYFFMQVTPDRYCQLGDRGNIVVTYEYLYASLRDDDGWAYGEDESSIYIIDAYESMIN